MLKFLCENSLIYIFFRSQISWRTFILFLCSQTAATQWCTRGKRTRLLLLPLQSAGFMGTCCSSLLLQKTPEFISSSTYWLQLGKTYFGAGGGVDGPRGSLKFSALVWVNVATQLVWSYQNHIGFHLFKHFTAKRIEKKQKSKFATLVFPFSLNTRNINHLQTPKGSVVAD